MSHALQDGMHTSSRFESLKALLHAPTFARKLCFEHCIFVNSTGVMKAKLVTW